MEIQRQIDETYFEYLKRVTEMLSDGLIGYTEYGDCILGEFNTYSDDNLRKAFYVIRKLIPMIESDIEYDVSDDTRFQQMLVKERELYKMSVRLRDQRRELRKWDTSAARYEHLLDVVKESIENMPRFTPTQNYKNDNKSRNTAILMLSDWHYGAVVDTQFNHYDTETAVERANTIFNKCVSHCLNHRVGDLYIEINGDMIHGLINVSNRVQSEEDVIEQITQVSELLATHINNIKKYFNKITVVITIGNHGRLMPDKKQNIGKENFEKLIPEILGLRLDKDIRLIHSQSEDFVEYSCGDRKIFVTHGHYDKVSKVYTDAIRLCQYIPDEIHLAHTHSYVDVLEGNTKITVNGSLMGSDDYAVTLRKNTKPSQNLIIYNPERCIYELGAIDE